MPSSPPAAVKLIRVVVALCGRSTSLPVRTVTLTGVGWGGVAAQAGKAPYDMRQTT